MKESLCLIPFFFHQSFERVLVENKLHGLSRELSEAIQSISRWELVQAALPHVLHCTSILLSNRNKLGEEEAQGADLSGSPGSLLMFSIFDKKAFFFSK